jgi:sugar/nucleoside kinase (ribokinase family)
MNRYDVLVYGPVFCDLIFTGLAAMPSLGTEIFSDDLIIAPGGSAIVANGLHRLGAKVGLIAELGNDHLSQVLWELMGELGLDRSLIRKHPYPLPQVTVSLSYPKDRGFVTCFHRPEDPPNLTSLLQENPTQHLHLCSFLAALESPDAAHIAHEAGATISMDPGWDQEALQDPRLSAMITNLDVFLPNHDELCQIVQEDNPKQAARQVFSSMSAGVLIVKDGANGVKGYAPNTHSPLHEPAIRVTAVDTTGAGDAFDAGYIYAAIQNKPISTCLKYGVICGGLTTRQPGGTAAFPTLKEVEQWLLKLQS